MSTKPRQLKVFLCHAPGDEHTVRDLYLRLIQDGVDAWLSSEMLVAGQDRDLEIARAVRESDAVVVCLSKQFSQAGSQQREARLALDTAMEQPEGEIFIIPARLEECETPQSLRRYHGVDLFTDTGYQRLSRSLALDAEKKNAAMQPGKIKPAGKKTVPVPSAESKGTPKPLSSVLAALEPLRFLLDIKYLGILITILVLLFGNNLYAQVTGHSIFAPAPTPSPTITATVTFPATATDTRVPTDTLTPVPPTASQTPIPPTNTLVPTVTVVPPVPLGEDWLAGCISTFWHPYPASVPASDRGDGCWNEPLHVFFAENGDLDFLAQRRNGPVETYGLFVALPERGTVTVRIRLRELRNADLWMGVFAEADVTSQGILMTIPAGDVRNRVFVHKDVSGYETINSTSRLPQGNGYSISFMFDSNSARSIVNPSVFFTTSVPIPDSQKWLFLGYRGLSGSYRVDGTFLSFELR